MRHSEGVWPSNFNSPSLGIRMGIVLYERIEIVHAK